MLSKMGIFIVKIYQRLLSPLMGPRCRFQPTCSEYCIQSFEKHGFFKGLILSIMRITRCNPLCKCGYDPVPPKGKWAHKDQDLYKDDGKI